MGDEKGKKKLMPNELIFENMLQYKTDQLKTKSTGSFAKSTDILQYKQSPIQKNSHALN